MPVGTTVTSVEGVPGQAQRLVEQVLEIGPHLLEARGVHVGQVVGDRVDVELLARHARRGRPQGSHHTLTTSFHSLPTSASSVWMVRWLAS